MSERVVVGVRFAYETSPEITELLRTFRDMVNYCIEQALRYGVTSFMRLRKLIYEDFKARWPDYHSHYCSSAVRIACSMLKSWRKRVRRGQADPDKPPRMRKLFIRFSPFLTKLVDGKLRISVRPRRQFIYVKLIYGSYQAKFIEAWHRGEVKMGEVVMNERWVVIPFIKYVDLEEPSEAIAIDVNEGNITAVDSQGNCYRWDISEAKRIRHAYFELRREAQEKWHNKPRVLKRVMAKLGRRERARIEAILHRVSKQIVEVAKGKLIILENLKGIRKRIKYGRKMNRRLHSWPFRKLQSMIEYKAKWLGTPVRYIDPRGTSTRCPICGERLENPEWHRVRCPRCVYEADRDVIACLNLLKMWGAGGLPTRPLMTLPDGGSERGKKPTLINGVNLDSFGWLK